MAKNLRRTIGNWIVGVGLVGLFSGLGYTAYTLETAPPRPSGEVVKKLNEISTLERELEGKTEEYNRKSISHADLVDIYDDFKEVGRDPMDGVLWYLNQGFSENININYLTEKKDSLEALPEIKIARTQLRKNGQNMFKGIGASILSVLLSLTGYNIKPRKQKSESTRLGMSSDTFPGI